MNGTAYLKQALDIGCRRERIVQFKRILIKNYIMHKFEICNDTVPNITKFLKIPNWRARKTSKV